MRMRLTDLKMMTAIGIGLLLADIGVIAALIILIAVSSRNPNGLPLLRSTSLNHSTTWSLTHATAALQRQQLSGFKVPLTTDHPSLLTVEDYYLCHGLIRKWKGESRDTSRNVLYSESTTVEIRPELLFLVLGVLAACCLSLPSVRNCLMQLCSALQRLVFSPPARGFDVNVS